MTDVNASVIYYSATGTIHRMAERLAAAAEKAGAQVRLRQVTELAPAEAIASNAAWSQHFDRTKDEPRAAADDIVWADVVLLGSPTRYGSSSSSSTPSARSGRRVCSPTRSTPASPRR